jgi:hypothetical protein
MARSDSRLDIYVSASNSARAGRDFAGRIFCCRTAEWCASGEDGISAAWRNFPRKVSSAIFAAAVKHGYLKSNFVRSVEWPPEPAKLLPVLRSDEQRRVCLTNSLKPTVQWCGWFDQRRSDRRAACSSLARGRLGPQLLLGGRVRRPKEVLLAQDAP